METSTKAQGTSAASEAAITLSEVEQLFTHEAALLDEWRLNEWLELVAEDGTYLVPSLDSPDSEPDTALFLIADDRRNLESRVRQLLGGFTWSENPRSRTRRLVTNARILESNGNSAKVTANFAVWRFQLQQTDVYVGRYVNVLVRGEKGLLIRERRVILDLETLRPHGKLSFLL